MTGLPNEFLAVALWLNVILTPRFEKELPSLLRNLIRAYPSYLHLSSRWMEIFIYLSRTLSSSLPKSQRILQASSRFPPLILLSNGHGKWLFLLSAYRSADLGIQISTLCCQRNAKRMFSDVQRKGYQCSTYYPVFRAICGIRQVQSGRTKSCISIIGLHVACVIRVVYIERKRNAVYTLTIQNYFKTTI